MKKNLVIFGIGNIAQLAHYYFSTDSNYLVVAFTVDEAYLVSNDFCGLPVVPFEKLEQYYSHSDYELFIAVGYAKLNQIRKNKYFEGKSKGYHFANYISSRATVLNQGQIGENCFILEDNTIQPFVKLGDNITLWSGNHIGHHSIIHDHCFIASHVVVSGGVEIGESCFIGVNATLRDHIKIGEKSVIGAGALILADVAPDSVYISKSTECSKVPSNRLRKI